MKVTLVLEPCSMYGACIVLLAKCDEVGRVLLAI